MKTLANFSVLLLAIAAVLSSGCAQDDLDYFMHGPSDGSYQPAAGGGGDSWQAQQDAARQANLRAVQEQSYKNEMQNYQNGYRSTLPNY